LAAFQTNPLFYSNSSQILSSADLNLIRDNARLVDGWSYVNLPALDSSAGLDTGTPGYYRSENPERIWWGSARMVGASTTLTITGRAQRSGTENLVVYVGGSDVSGSGTNAGTITLTGTLADFSQTFVLTGFSDGDVVPIEIRAEGTHGTTGTYIITDVYLSTISKSGWVAAPSFAAVADATDATKLNQLCDAIQWVYERIRLVPFVPRLALYYNLGPFKTGDPQHTNRPMYYGSVPYYYTNARLRVYGSVHSMTTTGWSFQVFLNGTLAYTSPTYGIGTQAVDQYLALSSFASLGQRVRVSIFASATNQGTANPLRFTRWTFGVIHAVAPSTGWPYATLPAAFTGPSATTNAETLRSRLASLATIVNDAKTRIDARPEQWARSRAMRRYFNRADSPDIYMARARPYIYQRTGNELFVKGDDVKVGYGPIAVTPDDKSNGWESYSFLSEESIDAQEGTVVYLDNLRGLDYGAAYRILGNAKYAAEYVG
jgi:hypothetical protein